MVWLITVLVLGTAVGLGCTYFIFKGLGIIDAYNELPPKEKKEINQLYSLCMFSEFGIIGKLIALSFGWTTAKKIKKKL